MQSFRFLRYKLNELKSSPLHQWDGENGPHPESDSHYGAHIKREVPEVEEANKNNNRFQKPFFVFFGAIIVALLIMQISYTIYETPGYHWACACVAGLESFLNLQNDSELVLQNDWRSSDARYHCPLLLNCARPLPGTNFKLFKSAKCDLW